MWWSASLSVLCLACGRWLDPGVVDQCCHATSLVKSSLIFDNSPNSVCDRGFSIMFLLVQGWRAGRVGGASVPPVCPLCAPLCAPCAPPVTDDMVDDMLDDMIDDMLDDMKHGMIDYMIYDNVR